MLLKNLVSSPDLRFLTMGGEGHACFTAAADDIGGGNLQVVRYVSDLGGQLEVPLE